MEKLFRSSADAVSFGSSEESACSHCSGRGTFLVVRFRRAGMSVIDERLSRIKVSVTAWRKFSTLSCGTEVFFFREGKGCVGSSNVKYEQERKESVKHKEQAHETTQNVCKRDATLVSTDRT